MPQKQVQSPIGILDLEPGALPGREPITGTIQHPDTLGFPIIRETVPGAWADVVVQGDPALESSFVKAAQRLERQGAAAITSDCGFSIRHQEAVSAAVNVPVALSALLLVPTILQQLPSKAQLAIMTFDSRACGRDLLGLKDQKDQARVLIAGIEYSQSWQNEIQRPPVATELAVLEEDVCERVRALRADFPAIGAVLLECTMFPRVSPVVRQFTGLPVYDVTTLCRMLIEVVGSRSKAEK
ncbi:hypothetical protein GGE61_004815 [Rhizobium leguminosarum]|uniref:hypothetical protein n=1 Tax=Rhizobium leguminosarum TaxID=384 RepID=UPI001617784B|nr:hypothetical protein [Rhizobium leguminosarum]MBB4388470.1 hypothetical protein [Rhizobium leguminosarum]